MSFLRTGLTIGPSFLRTGLTIATIELLGILELDNSIVHEHLTIVDGYINDACKRFSALCQKDKVAFYIVVLDKLLW